MKSVVYKLPIPLPEVGVETFVEIPRGSKLLSIRNEGVIYVQAPSGTPTVRVKFNVVPTGVEVEDPGTYLGTFDVMHGVGFHVFLPYVAESTWRNLVGKEKWEEMLEEKNHAIPCW